MFTNQRPQYLALIEEIKAGNIDVVVAIRLDRFNRAIVNELSFEQIAREYSCFLYAGDDIPNSHTSQGEFMRIIQMGFSQFHARQAAREVMESNCHNVKTGQTAGAVPPYGLKTIEKYFFLNEDEAPAVKLLFERTVEGFNYSSIIKELTSLGYRTRAGQVFTKSTLISMLRNEKYYGTYIYNRADGKKKRNRVLLDHFDPIKNETAIPPIISKELFDQVQAILNGRKTGIPVARNYLLTGFVRCKACGSSMVGTKYKGRTQYYRTYQCPKHTSRHQNTCKTKQINADYLENIVKKAITQRLNDYFSEKDHLEKALTPIKKALTEEISQLKKSISTLDRKISAATIKLTQTSIVSVAKSLESSIAENDSSKAFLTSQLAKRLQNLQTIEAFKNQPRSAVLFEPDDLFKDQKSGRILISTFINIIEIDDSTDEITIQFKH